MEENIKIEYISTGALNPYENNTRIHAEMDIGKIRQSIERYGFNDPIGIWGDDNTIVEGHGRLLAAKQIGLVRVPCIRLDHLTDEQRREYAIAHNRTAEFSEWDFDTLKREMAELDFGNFDLKFEWPEEKEDDPEAEDDNFEPLVPEEPRSKRGQVYKLGNHTLMCGDSTSAEDVKKLVGDAKIDLLLTDPPYGVDYHGTAGSIANDALEDNAFIEFLTKAFTAANSVMREGAAFYIWHADGKAFIFHSACRKIGWQIRQCIIWVKNSLVLGRQDYQWRHEPALYGWKEGAAHYFIDDRTNTTVIEDTYDFDSMKKEEMKALLEKLFSENVPSTIIHEDKPTKSDLHPTMKPLNLLARQVKNSSKKGENVLDLFGGSGSTLMTCEQMDRNCFMMEYDPKFVDVIIARWEEFTGHKAELIKE